MAGSVENVNDMIGQLLEKARKGQESEISSLQSFAESTGYKRKLEIQDVPYFKRHQSQELFNFDEEVIREYFPLGKVLQGLFALSEKLFNIKIVERSDVNKWDEDVKFYDVFDLQVILLQ